MFAPTVFSHAPPQGGFPGPVGGLAQTPTHGAGPMGATGIRDNARTIGKQTNGPVVHVLPVTLDVIGGYQGGIHQLMFVERNEARNQTNRHHMRSLTALNAHLSSLEARVRYGRLTSATHKDNFLAHWKFYGVQKPDLAKYDTDDGSVSRTSAAAFVIGKEAKCIDYWRATEHDLTLPGADLYLLAVRVKGDAIPLPPDQPDPDTEAFEQLKRIVERVADTFDVPTGLFGYPFRDQAGEDQAAATRAVHAMWRSIMRFASHFVPVAQAIMRRFPEVAAVVRPALVRVQCAVDQIKYAINARLGGARLLAYTGEPEEARLAWAGLQANRLDRMDRGGIPRELAPPAVDFPAGFRDNMPADDTQAERNQWWLNYIAYLDRMATVLVLPQPQPRDTYWQLVPYSSIDRVPPPPCLYNGPGWTGDALHIGMAGQTYDQCVRTRDQVRADAFAATFAVAGADVSGNLRRLPHVMVYLRSGERIPRT